MLPIFRRVSPSRDAQTRWHPQVAFWKLLSQCKAAGSRCSPVDAFGRQMSVCHFVLDLHKNATPPQCIVHREPHAVKFLVEMKNLSLDWATDHNPHTEGAKVGLF